MPYIFSKSDWNKMSKMRMRRNEGFVAVVAVIMIASGTLIYSIVASSSAIEYIQSVYRRESRAQAVLYASSCVDSAAMIVAKDYFVRGTIAVSDFDCQVSIQPVASDPMSFVLSAQASFNGVHAYASRTVNITNPY